MKLNNLNVLDSDINHKCVFAHDHKNKIINSQKVVLNWLLTLSPGQLCSGS
jgi:hypothetical protein